MTAGGAVAFAAVAVRSEGGRQRAASSRPFSSFVAVRLVRGTNTSRQAGHVSCGSSIRSSRVSAARGRTMSASV
jgi:hypothetical protein